MDGRTVCLSLGRHWCVGLCGLGLSLLLGVPRPSSAVEAGLPEPIAAALRAAQLPTSALALWVGPVHAGAPALAEHQGLQAMNPASVMKLVTTYAALDLLGPDYRWQTPVWLTGPVQSGRLQGELVLQGQGDPTLVTERLWLMLRRVRGLGVQHIEGDIVLDRKRFAIPPQDPADFDGEPLRAYNVRPDALLINYGALALHFTPDTAAGVAHVHMEPPLAEVHIPRQLPLSAPGTACGDWRSALRADFADATQIRLTGSYPGTCGEKVWHLAYADPSRYADRALRGMWFSLGGTLGGAVREGSAPLRDPDLTLSSRPLAEVIRDINKFSNNVMAQQLFLTLGGSDALPGPNTAERARARLLRWWEAQGLSDFVFEPDNGAGLSRSARLSARGLAQLLRQAYASAWMPDLLASLPIAGIDGTLRSQSAGAGRARLKTGSLVDVLAIAGVVLDASGQPLIVVALINHPRAAQGRAVLSQVIDWTASLNTGGATLAPYPAPSLRPPKPRRRKDQIR
ncbi:MAG: D-alanyl-D-alanine carboxypeptidase/D-alanyl-D-alanine-endopeptidase [Rhodoferax sp.]